jgi:hypothetical protein
VSVCDVVRVCSVVLVRGLVHVCRVRVFVCICCHGRACCTLCMHDSMCEREASCVHLAGK